ncbi:MAG TPA: metallophosphoesterase family protein [Microlunatus sp.]|nr:metallophosphoesterase family protein [Microlunatus sp.]
MHVVVVSDTHAPRFWKRCPPAVADRLEGADLILHAGDVCIPEVLDELAAFAPVRVVLGNNDGPEVAAWGAPETLELELDGLRVGMIHDAGPKEGRLARMRRRFPAADLVIFGHSHIPLDAADDRLRILNPGSPTDKRRQPHRTLAELTITDGRLAGVRIVELP